MVSERKKILTTSEVLKIVEDARQEWVEKFSPETIQKEVHKRLDKIMDKAIFAFLGLENDSGRIRFDRGYGRKSALFHQMEQLIAQRLPALAEKYISKVQERMGKEEIAALREEYKSSLRHALSRLVCEKAHKDAEIIFANLTKNVRVNNAS